MFRNVIHDLPACMQAHYTKHRNEYEDAGEQVDGGPPCFDS